MKLESYLQKSTLSIGIAE